MQLKASIEQKVLDAKLIVAYAPSWELFLSKNACRTCTANAGQCSRVWTFLQEYQRPTIVKPRHKTERLCRPAGGARGAGGAVTGAEAGSHPGCAAAGQQQRAISARQRRHHGEPGRTSPVRAAAADMHRS